MHACMQEATFIMAVFRLAQSCKKSLKEGEKRAELIKEAQDGLDSTGKDMKPEVTSLYLTEAFKLNVANEAAAKQ